MAKFVSVFPFDIINLSVSFYPIFVDQYSSEFGELGANAVGFDGETYRDYYAYRADTELVEYTFWLGGEFAPTGGVPPLTGTVEYLAVSPEEGFFFYISDLSIDLADVAPLLEAPLDEAQVHPVLLEIFSGDDDITLSLGADVFDAHTGFDAVNYTGAREDFAIGAGVQGGIGVQRIADTTDTDLLFNVEKLVFEDGSLIFDIDSVNVEFVYRIYAAAYGRRPDEGGLRFWTDVIDERSEGGTASEADQEFLASFFLTADEFVGLYGENPTNEEYINALYQNVLKREADEGGYTFWLDQIESGQGRDDMLIFFTESDENVANTAPDLEFGIWV